MSMLSSGSPWPHPTQTVSGSMALLLQPDSACCAIAADSGALLGCGLRCGSGCGVINKTGMPGWQMVQLGAHLQCN